MSNDSKEDGGKKSFSCGIKALVSCMPIKGMSLWCLIMKGMEITITIRVCLI